MTMEKKRLYIDWMDELRGAAVLYVLAYHCLFWPFKITQLPWAQDGGFRSLEVPVEFLVLSPISLGWGGVAIFFVVSGFCIHLSYLRTPNYRIFYWKRFWRIFPPYLIALLLFLTSDIVRGQIDLKSQAGFQFSTHFFLIHNFWKETHFGVNPSFWSVAVEVQLYAVYPLLILISKLKG